MNVIKKIALPVLMAMFLGAPVQAEVKSSAVSLSEAITHIDKAIIDNNDSNFASANLHLKAARAASELITGNDAVVKAANDNVIEGQIQSKQGNFKVSSALLNKSLELYKSL